MFCGDSFSTNCDLHRHASIHSAFDFGKKESDNAKSSSKLLEDLQKHVLMAYGLDEDDMLMTIRFKHSEYDEIRQHVLKIYGLHDNSKQDDAQNLRDSDIIPSWVLEVQRRQRREKDRKRSCRQRKNKDLVAEFHDLVKIDIFDE